MVKYLVIHNGSHHFKLIDANKDTYFVPFWGEDGYHKWLGNYVPTDEEVKMGMMERHDSCFSKFVEEVHNIKFQIKRIR